MDFEKISNLIEKYFAGETSLDDEMILRGYFNASDIDPRLQTYAPIFQFFEKEKNIKFAADKLPKCGITAEKGKIILLERPQKSKFQWWKLAAALAFLVVGSVVVFKISGNKKPNLTLQQHHKAKIIILDGEGDEQEALEKVNNALALVSKKMKKGTDETTQSMLKLREATQILNNNN